MIPMPIVAEVTYDRTSETHGKHDDTKERSANYEETLEKSHILSQNESKNDLNKTHDRGG